jgi:hypothetical protein
VIEENHIEFGNVLVDSSSIKSVTIKNIGDGPLIITSFDISLAVFTLPNNENSLDTLIVEPGDSYKLFIQFIPTDSINYNGAIIVHHNPDNLFSYILLEGRGVKPTIVIDRSIDFGEVLAGSLSSKTLRIGNNGTGDLIIPSYIFIGADSSMFRFINNYYLPMTLRPTHANVLTLQFIPTSSGQKNAQLILEHNASALPTIINLFGNAIGSRISITPHDVLNFGSVAVTRSDTGYISINNTGATPVSITGLEITGTDATMFMCVDEEAITLEPGNSYTFRFKFTPTSAGAKSAKVVFTHEIGTSEIELTGVGLIADIAVTPNPIECGDVQLDSYKSIPIEIKSTGSAPLKLMSLNITGENASSFRLSSNPISFGIDVTIAPGSSYGNHIIFRPDGNGRKTATLGIVTDLISISINITGNGIGQSSVDELEEIPTAYNLMQNYPNPFNPTTKIQYSLPEASYVRLSVYNGMGQEVMQLVNENQSAGKYIVDFNAQNLQSGVYFYRLQTSKFVDTKKMLLLK